MWETASGVRDVGWRVVLERPLRENQRRSVQLSSTWLPFRATGEACHRRWHSDNSDRHRLSRTHTDEVTNDGYRPPTMPHHRGKPSSLQSPTHLPPVRPHVQSPGALRSHPPSLTHTPIQPAPSYVQTPLPPPSLPDSERNVEAGWRVVGYRFPGGRGHDGRRWTKWTAWALPTTLSPTNEHTQRTQGVSMSHNVACDITGTTSRWMDTIARISKQATVFSSC
jgi:hypothetical protein